MPQSDMQFIQVAENAAAIMDSIRDVQDIEALEYLRESVSGFPGLWNLAARTGVALQAALIEANDPDCADHDFVEIVTMIGEELLASGHATPIPQWTDGDLTALCRKAIAEN